MSSPTGAAAVSGQDGDGASPVPVPNSTLARDMPIGDGSASMPRLIYGTAWKEDDTADLVYQALRAGFRAVDAAAMPQHYREDLVGEGIRRAIAEGIVKRSDLFIQTKFTPGQGPDSNAPYDPSAPLTEQVEASLRSSLANFTFPSSGPDQEEADEQPYIDCLVLHSPLPTPQDTHAVWSALAALVPHRLRRLGLSNVFSASALPSLLALDPRPAVLQNRFHRHTSYDVGLRALCRQRGVLYQSFWTLSEPRLLRLPCTAGLAARAGVSPEVALYALVLGLGGTAILDGTRRHMREDLRGVEQVGRWAEGEAPGEWKGFLDAFREYIHETP